MNYIIAFVILITVVVFIHEYGHYYFAKKYGVGVTDFSIGFGKEIFGFNDKNGTKWKFCLIPLGGYVKFFGDRNVFSQAEQAEILKKYNKQDQQKLFITKPLYQRALIVAAGPFANFVLAIVIFYLICGIGAAMSQVLMDINSQIPMIGASGAIGGVLGAYLINYPNAKVLVLIPFGFFSQLIKIRALYVLGFWFVLQYINSFLSSSSGGGVAYAAHIGGFISGVILILFFNKKINKKSYKQKIKEVKKANKGPWEQWIILLLLLY